MIVDISDCKDHIIKFVAHSYQIWTNVLLYRMSESKFEVCVQTQKDLDSPGTQRLGGDT